ncbi:MAG: hypothetical protein JF888_15680 [Candidatus Dormibacteraeota bacterium]|uniref:Uncharacterized protein n=1 Tax=Candidatus Dormiibacter inghamiae TaxID=3127013 RepID=A0A934NDH9_9BACT|nr:hypothetical protein [Candidatus Dormibacteraeota bacterium]MBJ7607785.1 hypothetical protein [Candidatus Dormibacteraeota bacterium]
MGTAREFEEADASVCVAPISAAVILNRLRDPVLLGPPLAGLALVEGLADLAVELVDVLGVEPVLKLIELGGEPCERLVVEAFLVLVALPQRLREDSCISWSRWSPRSRSPNCSAIVSSRAYFSGPRPL